MKELKSEKKLAPQLDIGRSSTSTHAVDCDSIDENVLFQPYIRLTSHAVVII